MSIPTGRGGRRPQGMIFDCDGTLVDSESLGLEVLIEFAAEFGLVMTSQEASREFAGQRMSLIVESLERRVGSALPETFVPDLRARMASAFKQRLRAMPGADFALRTLGLPVCVASSAPIEKIRLSLEITDLAKYFGDRIFSAYDIGSWKPAPDIFLLAAESLGLRPERTGVVEDSRFGIEAGLAAGMRVFALRSAHTHPHDFKEVVWIDTLAELPALLEP